MGSKKVNEIIDVYLNKISKSNIEILENNIRMCETLKNNLLMQKPKFFEFRKKKKYHAELNNLNSKYNEYLILLEKELENLK